MSISMCWIRACASPGPDCTFKTSSLHIQLPDSILWYTPHARVHVAASPRNRRHRHGPLLHDINKSRGAPLRCLPLWHELSFRIFGKHHTFCDKLAPDARCVLSFLVCLATLYLYSWNSNLLVILTLYICTLLSLFRFSIPPSPIPVPPRSSPFTALPLLLPIVALSSLLPLDAPPRCSPAFLPISLRSPTPLSSNTLYDLCYFQVVSVDKKAEDDKTAKNKKQDDGSYRQGENTLVKRTLPRRLIRFSMASIGHSIRLSCSDKWKNGCLRRSMQKQ